MLLSEFTIDLVHWRVSSEIYISISSYKIVFCQTSPINSYKLSKFLYFPIFIPAVRTLNCGHRRFPHSILHYILIDDFSKSQTATAAKR